jgi:Glycosyl hydrolases family 18
VLRVRPVPGAATIIAGLSAVTAAVAVTMAGPVPSAAGSAAPTAAIGIPGRVYAPYFETWTASTIPAMARKSGSRYFTLAFLQTPKPGSCTLAWNGDPAQTFHPGGRYVSQISQLHAIGGQVIVSLGGESAGADGTEIADSCHSVAKIAAAYERVITTYGVTRLDMDVEGKSLGNGAGLARRSEAIAQLQQWAARTGRTAQVDLTVGVVQWGLPRSSRNVIASAVAHHAAITVVNGMAFDYFTTNSHVNMGAAAVRELTAMHRQLAVFYPRASAQRRWRMEGITLMPGVDDNPRKTEVTSLGNAREVRAFAQAHRIPLLSIWAVQRDNGRCPGRGGANGCSGIKQATWAFSHLLERAGG